MNNKTMLAVSKAEYRGVMIFETKDGCVFVWGGDEFRFSSLADATECIDKAFAAVNAVVRSAKEMEALKQ